MLYFKSKFILQEKLRMNTKQIDTEDLFEKIESLNSLSVIMNERYKIDLKDFEL